MPAGQLTFGLDEFSLDDRLRLFSYVSADNRFAYLWVLRALDTARSAYQVVLHTSELAAAMATLHETDSGCPHPDDVELPRLLDALVEWGVLDRGQDSSRAATLAEYRNRHSVYQFTDAGYRAHRAVESVLAASLDDATLSRLVFADLLADLEALARANRDGDADEVYRKLGRLDRALADIAERAARFYHMLGDLSRSNDMQPEAFLAHKDALLAHLRDFHDELQRYTPRLRAAVHDVEATGVERLVEAAAEADERLFQTPAGRLEDWRRRWSGLRSWLAPAGSEELSEAERLSDATMSAIGHVLALLRRVTESRRGGVSRESQLRHLAQWFTDVGSQEAAHALFEAVFTLGSPRHVGVAYPDPEVVASRLSWWEAEPVELSRTLVQSGREPGQGNGRPARIQRDDARRQYLRAAQLAHEHRLAQAAETLAASGADAATPGPDGVLDPAQTEVLLRLLDIALATRTAGVPGGPMTAVGHGVRLSLVPTPGRFVTVTTDAGRLHLDGYSLTVSAAHRTAVRRAPPTAAVGVGAAG